MKKIDMKIEGRKQRGRRRLAFPEDMAFGAGCAWWKCYGGREITLLAGPWPPTSGPDMELL